MIDTIYIINGPNLNLLGKRETDIYGSQTFEDYFEELKVNNGDITLQYFQSNHEGLLLDKLHEIGFMPNVGVILNAGAYTHTSIALHDAIKGIETPVVEVHISNVYERETFRHHSYITDAAVHCIVGKGLAGYQEGIEYLMKK